MKERLNLLAKAMQRGDFTVFPEVYEQTRKPVFFMIFNILHDRALSEDIMQDAYMKMIESMPNYQNRNFLSFMLTIAKNMAINEFNRRKKTTYTDLDIDLFAPVDLMNHLEGDVVKKEMVQEALKALTEIERSIFLLYNLEELTHREIAQILDKPLGTITWMYQKALSKLRHTLKEVFDETP